MSGFDHCPQIGSAAQIMVFAETSQRIELGRPVVAKVMMQGTSPASRGNALGYLRIAPDIPVGIEVDGGPKLRLAGFDTVEVVPEGSQPANCRHVGSVEILQICRGIKQQVPDAILCDPMPQI